MEIIDPPHFASNPRRAAATRTVLQPEIDKFEQLEATAATEASSRGNAALSAKPMRPSTHRDDASNYL